MTFHKSGIEKATHRAVVFILCAGIIILGKTYRVFAEGNAAILQSVIKGENICLFIKGVEGYDDITGQIGREPIEIVTTTSDINEHTIILIDNSLSVTKDNLAKSKDILQQYIENKSEKEEVSLAVYGTDIQYLVEKETDGTKIVEALESVTSEDKDTYLTDVLYDELQKLEKKTEYTRFIVVTDGVDNKDIGYTKDELSVYLGKNSYPIYSIGCRYKNNDEQLKNLFAISRMTQAGYFLLDDYEEYDEIVNGLNENVTSVEIKVPDEFRDGSAKNILLTFGGSDGTVEISGELSMPFQLKEEPEEVKVAEIVEEPVIEEPVQPEPIVTPVEEVIEESEPEETSVDLVSVIAVAVIIIALIVFVVMNISNKKKNLNKNEDSGKNKSKNKNDIVSKNQPVVQPVAEDENFTVVLSPSDSEEEKTEFSMDNARFIVVLRDNNDSSKVFRYPLFDRVVIGRKYEDGVNIVLNYEKTVSAKHCEISMKGNKFYVRDLHSSNKTFLNGREVGGYMEFISGSSIKMGNLNMTIEIEEIK